jgi:hypothetical protein
MNRSPIITLLLCCLAISTIACAPISTLAKPSFTTVPTPISVPTTATGEPLEVFSVLPDTGKSDVATQVLILGNNFNEGATVFFTINDIVKEAGNIIVINSTEIHAESPIHEVGFASLVVANPSGETATLYNAFRYMDSEPAPLQPPELISTINPSLESINRHYSWQYSGMDWTWDLQIPESLYQYYAEIPRPPTNNYSVYITHPLDDITMDDLVSEFERVRQDNDFSELEMIEMVISFVQSLPYTADSVTTPFDEYPRYPLETLVENGGDCEDTSILLASLLHALEYETILIMFPDHVGVGILSGENISGTYYELNNDKYFYTETTGEDWPIGTLPPAYENVPASIYIMLPTPILVHEWDTTVDGTILELEVTVQNLGSATADDVLIFAGFDTGEDMLWNSEKSEPFNLQVNQQVMVSFNLQVPLGKRTRLVVQIIDDGHALDESYSEWVDT